MVAAVGLLSCAYASGEPSDRQTTTHAPTVSGAAGAAETGAGMEAAGAGWCAIEELLAAKCGRCHGAQTDHGAPFSLVTYADTRIENRKGEARFEAIAAAVMSDFMPPSFLALEPPVAALTGEERALLLDWCADGAPRGDAECAAAP
jgi:uncharacterized membrane protein